MMWLKMTEKIKVVPDTNVIISSIFWRGAPYKFMKRGFKREYIIILSPEILDEVIDKLRNKFNVPGNKIQKLISILIIFSFVIEPTRKINAVKDDPNDNRIIECAVYGNADYIVSGDRHLLDLEKYKSIKIVTPRDMLEILKKL